MKLEYIILPGDKITIEDGRIVVERKDSTPKTPWQVASSMSKKPIGRPKKEVTIAIEEKDLITASEFLRKANIDDFTARNVQALGRWAVDVSKASDLIYLERKGVNHYTPKALVSAYAILLEIRRLENTKR